MAPLVKDIITQNNTDWKDFFVKNISPDKYLCVHRRIIIMQSVFALLTSSKSEKFYYGNICVAQWSVIVCVISLFGQHDIVLANSKLLSQYKCHGEASGITTSSGDTLPLWLAVIFG